jgi:hypothetical protein
MEIIKQNEIYSICRESKAIIWSLGNETLSKVKENPLSLPLAQ